MFLSLNWLNDHVDLAGLSPDEIAQALTLKTALIEGFVDQRAALAGVVVGEVLESGRHPGADRLSLCRVAFGGERPASVVCGAPNVAAGQKILFAPVGTSLPNGVKLKASRIRGELSEGMICAEDELGLGPEHDGILVLDAGLVPGTPVAALSGLADVVFEIDNKSITHRPDLWAHRGFARELAAIFRRALKPLPLHAGLAQGDAGPEISLQEGSGCPLYMGLCLTAAPGRSPDWLRFRLIACGMRPRNLLVDLSNYVMLELGQPTHPFDRARLAGDRIEVRRALAGETLATLDGIERRLTAEDTVIADGARSVAIAGIMGGSETEVSDGTREVFLESAAFDPIAVRRTSSRLGLRTDALARFEKCLDPALVEQALRRYADLLRRLAPEAVIAGAFRVGGAVPAPRITSLRLPLALVTSRLGLALDPAEIAGALQSVGFRAGPDGPGMLQVGVPSWRATRDISIEEDLVEEVGRLVGYDRVPAREPSGPLRLGVRDPLFVVEERLRDSLCLAQGFTETAGYSTVSDGALAAVGLSGAALPALRNPLQQDAARLRPSVVPGLLQRLESWLRHESPARLCEVGRGYATGEDGLVRESRELGALLAWTASNDAREVARELQGVARLALRAAGFRDASARSWTPDEERPWFHPRRTAELLLGDVVVARFGAVAPRVLAALDARGAAGLLVFDIAALAGCDAPGARYVPVSRFPPARFDLAFVLPYDVSVEQLERTLRETAPRTLQRLEAFDVYRGKPLSEDERSVAFHLVFQAADRTLAEADTDKARARLVAAAESIGARLR
ncbi:MAG TPA: phenylalanine--tRNA ligase subunit beta [Planctomycetota bacterium]|nr:phenylalanine--tRNA ligase subunit beta [Planctomycetota bacterium]